jgi:sigma-B regulation protein RsbU (phosphoserine phosphatase)
MFVTAFLGCLDVRSGEVHYVNAGHNPPYHLRPRGDVSRPGGARGLPLGVFEDRPYVADRLTLRPGEGLFVFTDGVVEGTNSRDEPFEDERLEEALRPLAPSAPAAELVEGTLVALDAFVDGAPPADDVTVLALRWRGSAAGKDGTGTSKLGVKS